MSQRSLIKKIKRGNREAFSGFFREQYGVYVAYTHRFLKDKADATDIVQNAFIKLWENRSNLDPNQSLVAYMYTIVRNLSLNFIRDHQQKHAELDERTLSIHEKPDIIYESETSPREVLKVLVEALPERQREAFELSRIDGLQHEEIAEIMEVSPRTVNNHIVSALKSLRKAYDEKRADLLAL